MASAAMPKICPRVRATGVGPGRVLIGKGWEVQGRGAQLFCPRNLPNILAPLDSTKLKLPIVHEGKLRRRKGSDPNQI